MYEGCSQIYKHITINNRDIWLCFWSYLTRLIFVWVPGWLEYPLIIFMSFLWLFILACLSFWNLMCTFLYVVYHHLLRKRYFIMIRVLIGQHRGLVVVEVKLSSHYLNLVYANYKFQKSNAWWKHNNQRKVSFCDQ